jgi:hypothetical protein
MFYHCSFCPRSFQTSQQLGGHQTYHREELNILRGEHDRFMKRQSRQRRNQHNLKMVLLPPNPAFWVLYRMFGIKPRVIDFFQGTYELFRPKEEKRRNATDQDVDLTLKL